LCAACTPMLGVPPAAQLGPSCTCHHSCDQLNNRGQALVLSADCSAASVLTNMVQFRHVSLIVVRLSKHCLLSCMASRISIQESSLLMPIAMWAAWWFCCCDKCCEPFCDNCYMQCRNHLVREIAVIHTVHIFASELGLAAVISRQDLLFYNVSLSHHAKRSGLVGDRCTGCMSPN
jgi:hypothetical protein